MKFYWLTSGIERDLVRLSIKKRDASWLTNILFEANLDIILHYKEVFKSK